MKYEFFSVAKWISALFLILHSGFGFAQILPDAELWKQPVYRSLEAALKEPEKVYRLHLKRKPKTDSLPEAVFALTNLQELSIQRCKLFRLNSRINELKNLQYLILDHNKLVWLPDELCDLNELKVLSINNNLLYKLPDNLGQLQKLEQLNAWGNPLYVFPESIIMLMESLEVMDLRQIPFRLEEIEILEIQLPKTDIRYTPFCDCKINR